MVLMERREALASFGPTSAGVPWPFDRVRDGQSDFLVDARRSLSEGKHLLAHAPTGLGKTAVALVAALDYGLAADKLVLFLTSRQSHHRIAIETIRRIEARGLRIPTIDLIAKHSMCLQEAAPSHGRAFQEFCDFRVKSRTCSFFTRDNSAVVAAVLQRTLHVQELVRASSACRICPHRVAMDAAAQSRLVVCDYNYVFSDIRGRFLPRLGRSLEDLILIVDEAHNLPDRIRAHLVGDLSVLDVLRAAKEARSIDGEVAQELVAVAKSLERFVTPLRSERIARKDEFLDVVEEGLRTLGGDALPGGDVCRSPRHLAHSSGAADLHLSVPAGEPPAPRLAERHDLVRETRPGDARRDRPRDRGDRIGRARQCRRLLPVLRAPRGGPPSAPGDPPPEEDPRRATGMVEDPEGRGPRGASRGPRRKRRCLAPRRPGPFPERRRGVPGQPAGGGHRRRPASESSERRGGGAWRLLRAKIRVREGPRLRGRLSRGQPSDAGGRSGDSQRAGSGRDRLARRADPRTPLCAMPPSRFRAIEERGTRLGGLSISLAARAAHGGTESADRMKGF